MPNKPLASIRYGHVNGGFGSRTAFMARRGNDRCWSSVNRFVRGPHRARLNLVTETVTETLSDPRDHAPGDAPSPLEECLERSLS